MSNLHYFSNRRYERVELRVGYDEWRGNLQDHKVILSAGVRLRRLDFEGCMHSAQTQN